MSKDLSFRPDIEGLRALAVILVLAFHTGWNTVFSGGFVGVDVFFVISGFLITRNILSQAVKGEFSFRDFYIRRARRLFPALFFTVAATVAIGICFASPADLQHIGESAIASIFSVSNFYFWSQSGYFDSAAIQKPLLHTWSLAVEEQFYLVWPMVIVLLARYLHNRTHAVALLVALGVLSVWAAEHTLSFDPAGAFYLTPNRIGEFALGAICAWLPAKHRLPSAAREALALLGTGLILYAAFEYTNATRFPGLMALVPAMGAGLLIRFGQSGITQRVLASRPAVGIGRISYSLYLAHWPTYVFFLQWYDGELGTQESIAISAISLLLAMAMYRYIEQPFRIRGEMVHPPAIPMRRFVKLFASLTAGLVFTSMLIWSGRGWAWRFPDALSQLSKEAEAQKDARFTPYRERCLAPGSVSCDEPTEDTNVFIIGDSHAQDAFNALVAQYPRYHYVVHSLPACPPLIREHFDLLSAKHPRHDECVTRNEKLLYGDQLAKADLIVINTVFSWYTPTHLAGTIKQIRTKTRTPIVVFGNYLFFWEDVPNIVITHGSAHMDPFYEKKLAKHSLAFDSELKTLADDLQFTYVSKRQLFCKGNSALDCPLMFGNKLFTYDRHHLSLAAAREMGRVLNTRYNQLFAEIKRSGNAEHIESSD